MYIIRTVPAKIPKDRNYVVDQIDTVTVQNFDMRFLADLDDNVILLEWDIAVAQHDLFNFYHHARDNPHIVQVAPYVLYPESLDELQAPVWAHRKMMNELPLQLAWVPYGEPICDIFSTGMVYLPREIVRRLTESDDLVTWHDNITDCKLAFWHYYRIGEKVPIHWDVRPIHLHYDQEVIYGHGDVRRVGTRTVTHSDRQPVG